MNKVVQVAFIVLSLNVTGQTSFSVSNQAFEGVYNSYATFKDVDGDGDKDLFYCGANQTSGAQTHLMLNNGSGTFTESTQSFVPVWLGTILTGDLNGDGDNDVYITGTNNLTDQSLNGLYENNGSGGFSQIPDSVISPSALGDAVLFDCDGDTDLDLLITGADFGTETTYTKLYMNSGSGSFILSSESFAGLGYVYSTIKIGDLDADGDTDFVVMGQCYNSGNQDLGAQTSVYFNNGSGVFTVSNQSIFGLAAGDAELVDMDNDNDLDLFTSGGDATSDYFELYRNDGQGNFTVDSLFNIPALFSSSLDFFDADNDNDLDLFYCGGPLGLMEFKYYNNQGGVFTEVLVHPFAGINAGYMESEDVNGDGFVDLFATGASEDSSATGGGKAQLYLNNADAGLMDITNIDFQVFPNPNHGKNLSFSIQGLSLDGDYQLEIIDLIGNTVYTSSILPLNSDMISLELNNLVSGSYLIRLRSNSNYKQYTSKFIVL